MARAIIVTPALVVDISGDNGNVFCILSVVSAWMSREGFPPQFAEQIFDAAISSCSYAAALKVIAEYSGAQFVYCGRPLELGLAMSILDQAKTHRVGYKIITGSIAAQMTPEDYAAIPDQIAAAVEQARELAPDRSVLV